MYRRKGRILAGILAMVLVCTSSGVSALADETENPTYVYEDSASGTDTAGGSGTAEVEKDTVPTDGEPDDQDAPGKDEEMSRKDEETSGEDQELSGEEDGTFREEEDISSEEENDVRAEVPENVPENEETAGEADVKVITSWSWEDTKEALEQVGGEWVLDMPGATKASPPTRDTIKNRLPQQITAYLQDETEVTLDLIWDLSAIPERYVWSQEYYTASAEVPETYSLGEGVAELEVKVTAADAKETSIPTGTVEDAPFKNSIVDNPTETPGTTVNLFDYWLTERTDPDNTDPEYLWNIGINKGHAFNFLSYEGFAQGDWNKYVGKGKPARQGIVADTLGDDGYPHLDVETAAIGEDTAKPLDPPMNRRNGQESLAYLFDPDISHEGKESFADVDGLLQVDDEGYYYYDSGENFAAFYPGSNEFVLYNIPGVNQENTTEGGFFPFNDPTDVFDATDEYPYIKKNDTAKRTNMSHYFGLTMSTRFVQKDGGHTEKDGKEVTYEFTGDDDVWVFIDDVLVADLGGLHDRQTLSINFATGTVEVDGYSRTTIREQFEKAGKKDTVRFSGDTFADNTYHTLKFYYLERGNYESNMSLKFNLVTVPESDIIKVDQAGNPVPGATFELYAADDQYEIQNDIPIASGTTDRNGSFVFVDAEGYLVSLNDLYSKGIKHLVLRETGVPEGYRAAGDMKLYLYKGNEGVDGNIVLLSENQWETGAYASAKLTVKAPTKVADAYPITNGQGVMFAVVMKYVGNDDNPDLSKLEQWRPVSGDPLKDSWNVADKSDNESILTAAKSNPYIFQIDSSGAYKVEVENLPGDIKSYYFMLPEGERKDTKFAVMYFYAKNVSSVEAIENADSIEHIEETEGDESEFSREFAVRLYVPNIQNNLYVQKLDENGSPVSVTENGPATFSLYKEEDVSFTDGKITTSSSPVQTVETEDMNEPLPMQGGAMFTKIPAGKYYLIEDKAPDGYIKSETAVPVIVDNTGVYAYAGDNDDTDDGVSVRRGVGSIVHSMIQFATDDDIDATLHDIKAKLMTASTNSADYPFSIGSWQESGTSGDGDGFLHLQFADGSRWLNYRVQGTENGDYGYYDVESGWSKLMINQCMDEEHTSGTHSFKQDLKDENLANLFSGTVVVRVQNQSTGSLKISKTVTGEKAPAGKEFSFELSLMNAKDEPAAETYTGKIYKDNDATGEQVVISNGKATFTLEDGEYVLFENIPAGYKFTVKEINVPEGYTPTVTVDKEGTVTENSQASGSIPSRDIIEAAYTNKYASDFSFKKVSRGEDDALMPLKGARFGLYRQICEHDHSNDLIEIEGANGSLSEESKGCWALVETEESGDDGMVTFTKLTADEEYRLVELLAPAGYTLPKGQWKVTYDEASGTFIVPKGGSVANPPAVGCDKDGGVYIINYKPGELPFSGNTGIRLFLMIGGALMAFGAAGGGWYLYRRKAAAVRGSRG